MDEIPSTLGQRRLLEWLQFCESIGWSKESMPRLVDIFWQFKDRNGNLRGESSARDAQ